MTIKGDVDPNNGAKFAPMRHVDCWSPSGSAPLRCIVPNHVLETTRYPILQHLLISFDQRCSYTLSVQGLTFAGKLGNPSIQKSPVRVGFNPGLGYILYSVRKRPPSIEGVWSWDGSWAKKQKNHKYFGWTQEMYFPWRMPECPDNFPGNEIVASTHPYIDSQLGLIPKVKPLFVQISTKSAHHCCCPGETEETSLSTPAIDLFLPLSFGACHMSLHRQQHSCSFFHTHCPSDLKFASLGLTVFISILSNVCPSDYKIIKNQSRFVQDTLPMLHTLHLNHTVSGLTWILPTNLDKEGAVGLNQSFWPTYLNLPFCESAATVDGHVDIVWFLVFWCNFMYCLGTRLVWIYGVRLKFRVLFKRKIKQTLGNYKTSNHVMPRLSMIFINLWKHPQGKLRCTIIWFLNLNLYPEIWQRKFEDDRTNMSCLPDSIST